MICWSNIFFTILKTYPYTVNVNHFWLILANFWQKHIFFSKRALESDFAVCRSRKIVQRRWRWYIYIFMLRTTSLKFVVSNRDIMAQKPIFGGFLGSKSQSTTSWAKFATVLVGYTLAGARQASKFRLRSLVNPQSVALWVARCLRNRMTHTETVHQLQSTAKNFLKTIKSKSHKSSPRQRE